MRHDVILPGRLCRLRPVDAADAKFIAELRSGPQGRFVHSTSPDVATQQQWIEAYFRRPLDYYFVVEGTSGPEGTIGLYDVDLPGRSAEWGRWILTPGSLLAVESAMLLYDFAFQRLRLATIYCRTLVSNSAVVGFHRRFGLLTGPEERDGDMLLVRQVMSAEIWEHERTRVVPLIDRLAERAASAKL